ncbi:MAG: gephyrin-like molybdotransferase Glp [Gallionellaceae bacterium]
MKPTRSLSSLEALEDYDPDSIPVEQAKRLIHHFLHPIEGRETINLRAALHRTLAEDVTSPMNVPPHDYSAMDGYAVRSADLETGAVRFRLVGSSFAGHPFAGQVSRGECVRIMTGALIPAGCDSVIMQEQARAEEDSVIIDGRHRPGQNLRHIGEDMRIGEKVLAQGQMIRPAEMGLLASLGFSEISVFRKLKVAVFSTGDELQQPGALLLPGQIYDSNRYTLIGLLHELAVEVLDMGSVRDDRVSLKAALLEAADKADVIITSGGVSVGEADHIQQMLAEIGEVVFWKIAMKPGRPLAYGKIGDCHFFGLPGNPVAVMVTFQQFARDALRILMGQTIEPALTIKAVCIDTIRKSPGRIEFQRGILSQDAQGRFVVHSTGNQGSGVLSSMSKANCFIVLPLQLGNLEAGSQVDVQPFVCF